MKIHGGASCVLFVLACSAGASEPTNTWLLRGPETGNAYRIEIDRVSSEPIVGGISGLFRYDSGLGSWQYANAGAPSSFVGDIVYTTPQGRAQSTFAISGGYVVRSDDGGLSWTNVSAVLMAGQVSTLAARSNGSQTRIYAGVDPGDNSPNGGIWISTDFGQTWTQSAQTAGSNIRLVRVAALDPNLVFASGNPDPVTGVAGLFRSTDGGTTFTGPVAQTNGSSGFPVTFFDVAQDYYDANHFAAVAAPDAPAFTDQSQGGQLFTSTDAGQTWSATADNFVIAPETIGGGEPRAIMFDWSQSGVVYYATTWGLFKSVGGAAPVPASNGIPQLGPRPGTNVQPYDNVDAITQFWDQNHTMYVATRSSGIYVTNDNAATWTPLNTGFTGLNFRMFAFQPGNTGVVLAGSADPAQIGGLYRSTDGGATWARSSSGINPDTIRGIAFAPPPNSNVVLASGFPQQNIGGEFNKGVWRSTDSGQTWNKVTDAGMRNNGGKRLIQFDPNDASRVMISAGSSIHLSTDGGVTWINSINQSAQFFGLPMQVPGNLATPLGIAAGPGPVSGTRFYLAVDDGNWPNAPPAGAQGGVYYSDDGGYHWTFAGAGLPDDSAAYFSISPTAGTLFVTKLTNGTTRQGGVFRSTDYGANFTDVSATLPCRNVFTIVADPTDANTVWTACAADSATQPGGIFRSSDAGTTWVPYGRGLRVPTILWMTIDPADANHLLAGGYEGIHEMRFAADADQDGIPDSEEAQFASGDANNDGTQDAAQSYVASTGTTAQPAPAKAPAANDYVVVEIDRTQPFTGACEFVSDLAVVPVDQIPLSNRMQQAGPTIRFTLPNCSAARIKIRYSAVASYPIGVFGSYSPATPGDGSTTRWGLLDAAVAGAAGDQWTLQLDENAYGNVYAPGSGTIQFQGAPGRDSIFTGTFD